MDLQLKGKRALVCAASRGIGFAVARALAAEGAAVFVCARTPSAIETAAAQIAAETQGHVVAGAYDLTRVDAVNALAQAAALALDGGIDILVNNVGGPSPSAAESTDRQQWQLGFEQIFMSAVALSQLVSPGMKQRGFGRILTITSSSVVEPIEHLAVSTAMRAAVTTWMKLLATELAPHGVTVNAIMPGIIHTQRIEQLRRAKAEREGTTLEIEMQKTERSIPAGRLGRPKEVGDLACFLASPRAAFITGANIAVDGGARRSVAT